MSKPLKISFTPKKTPADLLLQAITKGIAIKKWKPKVEEDNVFQLDLEREYIRTSDLIQTSLAKIILKKTIRMEFSEKKGDLDCE